MNKIFILFFLLLIIACQTVTYIPPYTSVSTIDLTKYSREGFLITPYKYDADYESVGYIFVETMPEANLVTLEKTEQAGHAENAKTEWQVDKMSIDKIIDSIHQKALQMGANAIIDFKIEQTTKNYSVGRMSPLTIQGFTISGFAIKRLGAFK